MNKSSSECQTIQPLSSTSSLLFRFSCSVPDSPADLTFDPVSAWFSTGTQPRSVIQQNQNNKAHHSGNESPRPLFMCHIQARRSSVRVLVCLGGSHSRQLVLLQSMLREKEADGMRTVQSKTTLLIMKANYAHSTPWMLVWYGNDSQHPYATLRNVISIII